MLNTHRTQRSVCEYVEDINKFTSILNDENDHFIYETYNKQNAKYNKRGKHRARESEREIINDITKDIKQEVEDARNQSPLFP